MTLNNEALIKRDRLRFTKNKLSANLTLLAIVCNALYFISLYSTDISTYYYNVMIGVSVVYNLLFMLISFLSSEGVKSYKLGYSFVLMALGVGQIIRIFVMPMAAKNAIVEVSGVSVPAMDDGQFIYITVLLVASAALCIVAGIVNFFKTRALESYQAELDKKAKGSKT